MTPPSQAHRRLGVVGTAIAALVAPVVLAGPVFASATANEVVYTADDNNDGVYSVVIRDLESRRVTTVLPADTSNQWIYDDPELSPSGQQVAFSTDRAGGEDLVEGIAVVNRDGSGFRRLTTPPATDTTYTLDVGAAWSPDGTRIAFTRITVTGSADPDSATIDTAVLTVPAAGGAATALVGAENGYTVDWSPDGSKIVFADIANPTANGVGPLTVVNSNGTGGAVPLGVTGYAPAWSPDGGTIAYSKVTPDGDQARGWDVAHIATVPATGGAEKVLAPTKPGTAATVAEYPSWTPDGEAIVYDLYGYSSTDDFPPGDLWAVDRNGVRAGRVTATTGDEAQPDVHGPVPSAVSAGAASTYTAVTPKRILDTRSGLGGTSTKVGAGQSIALQVHGVQTAQGPVPANASAVVLNLTVTGTTSATDVRAYPTGTGVPGASNLNAGAGQTVPNLATVRIGDGGRISLYNSGGTVHLIADIAGYYTPDSAGSGFAPVEPTRIADSRRGQGCVSAKVPAGGFCDLQVTGVAGVPASATAVVLNVTATGATATTDVRVYPAPTDASVPEVSNLNVRAGQTTPNLVTVAIGAAGKVRMRNAAGAVDLIADVAGYYSPTAPGRFVPVAPTRFLDTRSGVGGAPIPVTAAGYVDLKVAGTRGVPAGATAAVINLTGTGVTASTDVRAYPLSGSTVPEVSNLNLTRGVTRANLAIVKTGVDGRVRVRNGAGSVNLIGDLAGYMIG